MDQILNGATPADLPVRQQIAFEPAIDLKTANALELTLPPSLLLRANEVIQLELRRPRLARHRFQNVPQAV